MVPLTERVIAVVTTFRPSDSVIERLASLRSQVDSLIVIDDGSGSDSFAVLDAIESSGFELVRNPSNLGIGAALNAGTRLALARGADFVLTVDQDTQLADDYVANCLNAFRLQDTRPQVGVASAESINGSFALPEARTPSGLGIVREAIQSGFLISRHCLETCGLFDARLFIDDVDTEYCLRISARGFATIIAPGAGMRHSLGELVQYRPFGLRPTAPDGQPATYQYHAPFRRYFIVRNNIDLYFRYLRRRPRWVASSVKREFEPTVKSIIAGPHRGKQVIATMAGVAHGLIRRRGPLSPRLASLLTPSR